jgi:hypothetical protein
MKVKKDKLPKGRSYPVRTGMIAAALEASGIPLDCSLNYLSSGRTGFTAYFWPQNQNCSYERLYVTICTVSNERAAEVRQRMSETVLPTFTRWIGNILTLPTDSPVRREQQVFHLDL